LKPKFNIPSLVLKKLAEIHCNKISEALAVEPTVENAVLPIYWVRKKKPEQIGSGVVVRVNDEFFIFSASHVFDSMGEKEIMLGAGDGSELVSLSGERFSSKAGLSGTHLDDPIDASVLHIKSGLKDNIKDVAIKIDDICSSPAQNSRPAHMAVGFRIKNSNTAGDQANSKRECFPSVEYGDSEYSMLGLDSRFHLALAFENQVFVDGKWQTSPTPRGISGGAIVEVRGVDMSRPFSVGENARQYLSAITIEQRRGKSGKPGALIGTRISVHLGLIEKYLPGLLNFQDS